MLKKKKFIISGIVLVAAFIFLLYQVFASSVASYTVSDLLEKGDSVYGKNVRVEGTVVPNTINKEDDRIEFRITDDTAIMQMVYQGAIPQEAFKDGAEVTAEGKLTSDGTFIVSEILTKCPSKYEAE